MKVLVLAAGRSTRMNPVSDKNFLNFLGKPLIVHQLEMLKEKGLNDVVLVGGAHNLQRLSEVSKGLGMNIEMVAQEDLDAGMSGAVLSSADRIAGGEVLVLGSNDIVEAFAFDLIKKAEEEGDAESYLLGMKVSEYFPGGYLETDSGGFISSIVEKPGEGNEPSDLVNLVVHFHKDADKLVEYLKKTNSENDDKYEVALDAMMKDGVKFKAVSYDGVWQPIKYPWHIQKVFNFLFDKAEKSISKTAEISDKATVKGDVIIADGVKIFEGAIINGPVYLGRNVVVANNALVRDSHIGPNSVIGFSTEIARSYLGSDVWTHSNYIGDSVIGNNVSFGAGTVTGNLRLDEKNISVDVNGNKIDTKSNKFGLITGDNIRVGVNTSFMPGVKVGSESFIGAGIVISQDVNNMGFVKGVMHTETSENRARIGNRDDLKKNL